jgi:hypothetical protein
MIGLLLQGVMTPWLSKHGGTLLKLLAVAAALISILTLGSLSQARKRQLNRQDECFAYLAGSKGGQRESCPPTALTVYDQAVSAQLCEAALKLDGYSDDCPVQVGILYGDRAALRSQLKAVQDDQSQSIARAEARATASAQRKSNDVKVLAASPRDRAGLVVCDTACLRARFNTPGPDRP